MYPSTCQKNIVVLPAYLKSTILCSLYFLLSISFLQTTNAQAPNFQWVGNFGNPVGDYCTSTTLDNAGNLITIGNFGGTVDFDPGAGTYNLTAVDHFDVFILKLNSAGNFIWAKSIGGSGADLSASVKTDNYGNSYIAGTFSGIVDFDPGPGIFNLSGINGQSFLLKLDVNGNFLWAIQFMNTNILDIETDAGGNIYATGDFRTITDFDPGPGVYNLTSFGNPGSSNLLHDVFILKINAAGNFVWVKQMGGIGSDHGMSIALDINGNIVTTGEFRLTGDFDPGSGVSNLTALGFTDVFISKLDVNGNLLWAKQVGGVMEDFSRSVATDNFGNVYLGGNFYSTTDFDPGSGVFNLNPFQGTIFVLKLNSSGSFVWAKQIGSNSEELCRSLTLDNAGNVYLTGHFKYTADFDPGPAVYNLPSNGTQDAFILKLDNGGNFLWAVAIGSAINSDASGLDIIVDQTRNVYTVGVFFGVVDFDPGPGNYNVSVVGDGDAFIQKLSQCANVTYSAINAFACNSYTLNSQVYTISGTYTQTLNNSGGCDSVITLTLVIGGSNITTNTSACDSYLWQGQTYTASGAYTRTYIDVNGCDSIINLNLIINNSVSTNIQATICEGQSYAGHTTAGIYTDNYTTTNGCDSIRTLNLTVKARSFSTINASICQSQSYAGHNTTGTHIDTFIAANGCDSIRTLYLLVNPAKFTTITASICQGQTFAAGGGPQTISGLYKDTLQTYLGCDSIITTILTVHPKPRPYLGQDRFLCEGTFITLDPGTYNTYQWHDRSAFSTFTTNKTGIYWVKVTDIHGCMTSDTISIAVKNCLRGLFIPNTFTPNGDTKNDVFKPIIYGTIRQFEFRVLNRYGEIIFYTKDVNKGWDGKFKGTIQNTGAFTWTCTYQIDQQMVNTEKGSVLLLR